MKLGIVGLGRMGMNMAYRLLERGHEVVVSNRSIDKIKTIEEDGAIASKSLEDLVLKLTSPRIIWLMLPAGKITEEIINSLEKLLSKDDIIIEGGNTNYKDDIRRAKMLEKKGIKYIDAGVSGGIWGRKNGYCTMVGGEESAYKKIEPILKDLAPENGYLYCGETGAGHFVKMIHNGIEYAMMEAYGEGFELLKASPYGEKLNLSNVAHLWNQGSVIRSWLLELLEPAFAKDPNLDDIQGYVEDSGEGRWTVNQAIEAGVSAPVIAQSLFKRFQSRQRDVFSDKVIAALRKEFGGHATVKKDESMKQSIAGAGEVTAAKAENRNS